MGESPGVLGVGADSPTTIRAAKRMDSGCYLNRLVMIARVVGSFVFFCFVYY